MVRNGGDIFLCHLPHEIQSREEYFIERPGPEAGSPEVIFSLGFRQIDRGATVYHDEFEFGQIGQT
jgi:hypothetical protein